MKTTAFYYVLMVSVYVTLDLVIFPTIFVEPNERMMTAFRALFWICIAFNIILNVMDPGHLKKNTPPEKSSLEEFMQLMFSYDSSTLCFEC